MVGYEMLAETQRDLTAEQAAERLRSQRYPFSRIRSVRNESERKTQSLFANAFGYPATHTIQAPGRVNLIGEHTDYNDGFVLPCAIDYQTVISCAPRDDRKVRVMAADYENQLDEFSLDAPIVAHENYQWANYVRGVVKHLQLRNNSFGGVDMVISGNVPQGAG